MDVKAERHVNAVQNHLVPNSGDQPPLLHPYAAAPAGEQGYSVVLQEKLETGICHVRRSRRSPSRLISRVVDNPEISTLHDNFVRAADIFRDNKYLGTRVLHDGTIGESYKWMTYGEADTSRSAIGSGLIKHGITKGSCVGLFLVNKPEWVIVDHACSAYSLISVPLYDTLGPESVKYIVNHVSAQAIVCDSETLDTLLSFLSETPSVHLIVVVGRIDVQKTSSLNPSTNGVQIVSYSELYHEGLKSLQPFSPPTPDDIATICYTSGTTGTPKGVVLSHGNFIASAAGSNMFLKFYPSDVHISYLPLAHVYERINQIMLVYCGGASGFYQGDNTKLLEDVAALKPTIFCSVPRLYNRIYHGVMNSVKMCGFIKKMLFNAAYKAKKQAISNEKSSIIWDMLVFNKLKEKLGGRVRCMISGASPLSPDVMDFLRVCFGCKVVEGYGMTEASGAITCMDESDNLIGHVGSPIPSCEVKLVDVPEMKYTYDDQPYPRGEICTRGPIVFQGYYKDETQTREVVDEDGWLHTGDIGLWLPGGQLKIIDRKKNIFKLVHGEYIAPEKIENVYAKCKFVAQCFIYGDSLNSALVAIVVVDHDVLKEYAATQGIKYVDVKELCGDHRARVAVLADMDTVAREAQLRGFEFAKAVTLEHQPFTLDNGLLTPTLKIKRPQAKAYFAGVIATLYSELSPSQDSSLKYF
ncbi:hypothetical protein ABFS83_12G052200 [Erythranthe nasuta]